MANHIRCANKFLPLLFYDRNFLPNSNYFRRVILLELVLTLIIHLRVLVAFEQSCFDNLLFETTIIIGNNRNAKIIQEAERL